MKKFLFDLIPLLLFFVVLKVWDIYTATAVAIAASFGQILWLKLTHKKIEMTHWVNLIIITVFGGLTIYLHDERFIKWKPTILYWLFAAFLLVAFWIFKKNFIRKMMEKQVALPDAVWTRLLYGWVAFFASMGIVNLVVAFSGHFTTEQWASFKVFGATLLMIAFVIGQSLYIGRYLEDN